LHYLATHRSPGDNRVLSEKVALVKGKFRDEFRANPALKMMGGADDGTIFPIRSPVIILGRSDPAAPVTDREAIVLSEGYRAVTHVSHPHAHIVEVLGEYYLEDRESTGGTFVNGRKLLEDERVLLKDGALTISPKGPRA
jgi:pSer/pThr/pTyr-binding forkhead associated (FHA) protein